MGPRADAGRPDSSASTDARAEASRPDADAGVSCHADTDCPAPSAACAVVFCDDVAGVCHDVAPDADHDGHGDRTCASSEPGDDCDDGDASRFPHNTEVCDSNGHDEDCDPFTVGDTDEDGDGQVSIDCNNLDDATGEVINGPDCDDHDIHVMAAMIADGPTTGCDGVDNDCDGQTDVGCACAPAGLLRECGLPQGAVGACHAGLQTCAGGAWGDCLGVTGPMVELCDPPGVDEDCDGAVDDGCAGCTPADGRPCGGGMFNGGTAACRPGLQRCRDTGVWGSCDGAVGPRHERCDGMDDDCDGTVDEEPDATASCAVTGVVTECRSGRCVVTMCPGGQADCDMDASDGCEEELATSAAHCGSCGHACAAGQECVGGVCDPVVGMDGGALHTCAVRSSGVVMCWGDNRFGQLGNGTTEPHSRPTAVLGLSDAVGVCAGAGHSCAVRRSGAVACWGANDYGMLGNGESGRGTLELGPTAVIGISDVVQVTCGYRHTCARTRSGAVLCWGGNDRGQLGSGSPAPGAIQALPTEVAGLPSSSDISAGVTDTCVIAAGKGYCWGANDGGQLGDGSGADQPSPARLMGDMIDIEAGGSHGCGNAVESFVCWGANTTGAVGDGTGLDRPTPTRVSSFVGSAVACGSDFTCGLAMGGRVQCWGSNYFGQLGTGGVPADRCLAPADAMIRDAVVLGVGALHACAVVTDGSLVCWGANDSGQLGDGTMDPRSTPTAVVGIP